jgi:hypothetical protein
MIGRDFRSSLSKRALNAAENSAAAPASFSACGKLDAGRRLFRDDLHKPQIEDCYTFESLTHASSFSARSFFCFF